LKDGDVVDYDSDDENKDSDASSDEEEKPKNKETPHEITKEKDAEVMDVKIDLPENREIEPAKEEPKHER